MEVKIYQISKSSMQSAPQKKCNIYWKLEFCENLLEKFKDPLMGWTGSSDPKQELNLMFDSIEAAIKYAKSHSLQYDIIYTASKTKQQPKAYADNFKSKK